MYEPIRTQSVHSLAAQHWSKRELRHSREEQLDIRLAGHLTALLTVTDELRALAPSGALDDAADRLADLITRMRGSSPLRAAPSSDGATPARIDALHQRAHQLAGQALVVAVSAKDTAGETVAAASLRAHAAALGIPA
ncbi:SCO4983 family protein [Streptomyces albireticuli]|uniref:SCO4983 family protein n=1 Tax=Streptomyces albireticuli TaxID=1940 RepID=UPI0036CC8A47